MQTAARRRMLPRCHCQAVVQGAALTARLVRLAIFAGVAGGLAGCAAGDPAVSVIPPVPARLAMNYPAVNLSTEAPYHTVQLAATPLDSSGKAIEGLPAPTFRLAYPGDTFSVRVTDGGLVTAVRAVVSVRVVAELSVGDSGQVYADTAMVRIKDLASPPALDTLSIRPLSPADTLVAMSSSSFAAVLLANAGLGLPGPPTVRAVDAAGGAIAGLYIAFESLDTAVVKVDRWTGVVEFAHPGRAHLVARTYAYGIVRADTVVLTVTWPAAADIAVNLGGGGVPTFETASPLGVGDLRVAPGAVVMWTSYLANPVDVTFDDPSHVTAPPSELCTLVTNELGAGAYCGTGNIVLPANADPTDGVSVVFTIRLRQFLVPGVYPYHTPTGAGGTIVVEGIE